MQLKELGGEFAFIERYARQFQDPQVLEGIGDDCAVVQSPGKLLVTTDMMVEGDHFRLDWSTPWQVGSKLVESNVSDIVCKGGTPRFAFLSLCLRSDCTVATMDGFYAGLYAAAERHGLLLLGGDTTHGPNMVCNLTVIGSCGERTPLRSGARPGDLLCVTGHLGASTAGLKLLLHGAAGDLKRHLEPRCRTVAEGRAIASLASASIDVSDGLGSETRHICRKSGTGARILAQCIPLVESTRQAGATLGLDPLDFALYGGEDYEVVFTLPPQAEQSLRKDFDDWTVVGEILPPEEGIYLEHANGRREELKRGYDHFA